MSVLTAHERRIENGATCNQSIDDEKVKRMELTQFLYESYQASWKLETALVAAGARVSVASSLPMFEMNALANRVAEFVHVYAAQHDADSYHRAAQLHPTEISIPTSDTAALELLVIESLFFYNYLRAVATQVVKATPDMKIEVKAPSVPDNIRDVAISPQSFFADARINARYFGNHSDVMKRKDVYPSETSGDKVAPPSAPNAGVGEIPQGGGGISFAEMTGPSHTSEEEVCRAKPTRTSDPFEKERQRLTQEIKERDLELRSSREKIKLLTAESNTATEKGLEKIRHRDESLKSHSRELNKLREELREAYERERRSQDIQIETHIKLEAAQRELVRIEEQPPQQNTEVTVLKRQVNTLKSQAREYLAQERVLKTQLTQSQKVQRDLQDNLRESNREIERARADREGDREEIMNLKKQVQDLQRRCETLGGSDLETEIGRCRQLEALVTQLRRELEAANERDSVNQIRIEALRHKVQAKEWFQLETYTLIKDAAADGRLVALLDPQTIVMLLDKLAQLKKDAERSPKLDYREGHFESRRKHNDNDTAKPLKEIA